MTRSGVKRWRKLVACDSRKQKLYHLNQPLQVSVSETNPTYTLKGTIMNLRHSTSDKVHSNFKSVKLTI